MIEATSSSSTSTRHHTSVKRLRNAFDSCNVDAGAISVTVPRCIHVTYLLLAVVATRIHRGDTAKAVGRHDYLVFGACVRELQRALCLEHWVETLEH